VARIEAVLRRAGQYRACDHEVIEARGFTLDVDRRDVYRDGRKIELTAVETDILELLMRSAGRAVSRDELSAVLYSREGTAYERSVDVHISHLRRKLDASNQSLIRSVRGIGYIFIGH
jgi:two-component system response regulator CpxR